MAITEQLRGKDRGVPSSERRISKRTERKDREMSGWEVYCLLCILFIIFELAWIIYLLIRPYQYPPPIPGTAASSIIVTDVKNTDPAYFRGALHEPHHP